MWIWQWCHQQWTVKKQSLCLGLSNISTVNQEIFQRGCRSTAIKVQSLPIQMRATILYLANLWMDFKMLFTTNIFLYLVKVLLLTCPLISQFIAHFWSICPFLCTASFTIPIIVQVRAAAKHTLPLLPLLPSFSSFPSVSEQNGGPKKALNPQNRGTEGV